MAKNAKFSGISNTNDAIPCINLKKVKLTYSQMLRIKQARPRTGLIVFAASAIYLLKSYYLSDTRSLVGVQPLHNLITE